MKILIINTGGNVLSLKNILEFCGYEAKIYENFDDLKSHDIYFLPGIGSFDNSVQTLKQLNIFEYLKDHDFIKKKIIVGICVGMQILFNHSEEGSLEGLSLIEGSVKKFTNLHMGWNEVYSDKHNIELDRNLFYFAHNYYVDCDERFITAYTKHLVEFPAIVKRENIYGIQFHPEKSHSNGINLLKKLITGFNQ